MRSVLELIPVWFLLYILWNLVCFFLMRKDKHAAVAAKRRIRERTLFLCAAFGGAAGILLGMYIFHHKTRHLSFVIGIPFFCLLNIAYFYGFD